MAQCPFAFFGPFEGRFFAKESEEGEGVLSGSRDEAGQQGEHAVHDLY